MKHILAFEGIEQYQDCIRQFKEKSKTYEDILKKDYALRELPKGVIWTSEELATSIFSEIPIPAFTNEHFIYMCPDVEAWRRILVRTLEEKDLPKIKEFYQNYNENHLLVILAHELTHHSDLFMDEFDGKRENSIWFEEGMCF